VNQIARLIKDAFKAKVRVAPYTAVILHWLIRPTTHGSELWSHWFSYGSVQVCSVQISCIFRSA